MSRWFVLLGFIALAHPGASLAQATDYARSGFYIGLDATGAYYTQVEDDLEEALFADIGRRIPVSVDVAVGLDARIGYRLNPRFAFETQLRWLNPTGVDTAGIKIFEIETLALTGNLKVYLVTGSAQPYFLVGLGVMTVSQKLEPGLGPTGKEEDYVSRFGVGIDLYVNRNILISLETAYMRPGGNISSYDQISFGIGLQYRL